MNILNLFRRKPDFIVGGEDNPYLLRWWIIPRNRFFNIYLHKFCRSDDDRALHDHPWPSCSFILTTGYWEHLPGGRRVWRKRFRPYFRRATAAHRVELKTRFVKEYNHEFCHWRYRWPEIPAWTLFITGPKIREWGFHCPQGWRHWEDFVKIVDGGNEVGRGCA